MRVRNISSGSVDYLPDSTIIFKRPKSPAVLTLSEALDLAGAISAGAQTEFEGWRSAPDAGGAGRRRRAKHYQITHIPNAAHRMPREKAFLVARMEPPTRFEAALKHLGSRVKETKDYYTLDGKPCNAPDLLKAAEIE